MPFWEFSPLGEYIADQPRYDAAEERRKAEEEVKRNQEDQANIFERVLSLLGRPGEMVRGAISGGLDFAGRGLNPLEGAAAGGLVGAWGESSQYPRLQTSGSGILEHQFGLGEGPSIGPLNARGIAGFGLDVATDPLSLIPGHRVTQGLRAVPEAIGLAVRGIEAAPYISRAADAYGTMSRFIEPVGSAVQRGLSDVAERLPGVGGALDVLSPRIRNQNPEATAYRLGIANIPNEVEKSLAALEANPIAAEIRDAMSGHGRIPVIGGKQTAEAVSDVFQRVHPNVQPEWRPFIAQAQQVVGDVDRALEKTILDAINIGVPDETVERFFYKPTPLKPGEVYFPRVYTDRNGAVAQVVQRQQSVNTRLGFMFDREFETQERALAAGFHAADPVTAMRVNVADKLEKINQLEMNTALVRAGRTVAAGIEPAGVSSMRGMLFAPEDARFFERLMRDEVNPTLRLGSDIAAAPRMLQTGYDMGGMMIQGIVTLATRPADFLKATALSVRSLFRPENHAQFLASPEAQEVFAAIRNLPVGAGSREFFEDPRGLLGQGLQRLGPAGEAVRGLGGHFQASFDTLGDAIRVYGGQAWLGHIQAHPGDANRIGDFLGHMSGTTQRAISSQQSAAERTMFFAPSYTASAFALMGSILQGGVVATEAAKSIASMLVVGLVGYERMAQAVHQDPVYDPSDSRFMTLQVGNTRLGVGSVWTALARSLGNIEAKAEGVVRGQTPPPQPSDLLDPDNPFLRFWRGRLSTPASSVVDLLVGETYLGKPINNIMDVARETGQRLIPFTASGAIEAAQQRGAGPGDVAANAAAGFAGLRAFPESFQDVRNDKAREKFGTDFNNLNTQQKAEIQALPEIQNRPIPPSAKFDRARDVDRAYKDFEKLVNTRADQVNAGQITKDQFRKDVSDAQDTRNVLLEAAGPPRDRPLSQPEQVRRDYLALLGKKDEFGNKDYDTAEIWLKAQRPRDQEFIKARQEAGTEFFSGPAKDLMDELRQARETLKPYREIRKEVMQRFDLWDRWADPSVTPAARDALTETPQYRVAQRVWQRQQETMRRVHPEVDAALVAWYSDKPILMRRR